MFRLEGKGALFSGGSRGIGAATARALAAEGEKVVIGDVLDAMKRARGGSIINASSIAGFVAMTVLAPDTRLVTPGRAGHPSEVGRIIVFLASGDSSFSAGAELALDGGETAGNLTGGSLSAAIQSGAAKAA